MIDPALYAAFVAATVLLMLLPGPNVALIVANSVAYGTRFGLLTVAGTSSAMVPQMALTALGLSAALGAMGHWFGLLRWAGVAYLLVLGIRQWRAPVVDFSVVPPAPRSARRLYFRGVLVSLTNPKTLFFYGAFFPQFIAPGRPAAAQAAVLAVTFVAIALVVDSGWAVLAGRARRVLAARGRLRNRVSGGLLVGAGAGLALAHAG